MKQIKINDSQFQNVLKKAIAVKPLVRPLRFLPASPTIAYLVRGSSGDFYAVRFQRSASGKMLGSCLCAGAMGNYFCYHLAAAMLAHCGFVRSGLRPAAPSRSLPASLSYSGDESVRNLI